MPVSANRSGRLGAEELLPAGTVTFVVTDDGLDVHASAHEALAAAIGRQTRALPVRIGVATGDAHRGPDGDYVGAARYRGAQLRDAAHAGQTVLSSVTAALVADDLPDGWELVDRGVHRLRDLSQPERIFVLAHSTGPADDRPLLTLDSHAHNLPVQLTTFVGRVDELAAVAQLLDTARLVTLSGAGGCGKTRLAVQAVADDTARWPDGVWWVELGSITDRTSVADRVATTAGVLVEPLGGALRALAVQLRDRRVLVCLDNCEHLVDAAAETVEALLRACPGASVLATSREPLGVAGEKVWRVPSLVDDDAVTLFIERASRVRPWFTLDAANDAVVRAICRRLDGIPLAIELAAARIGTLTPAQIGARLDDRLALLVRGPRGAIARHQTLAASIAWSHDLLDDTERSVFRRLAVFAGGFTLDAACAVCACGHIDAASVFDAVGRLVDKSLIAVDEIDGDGRYRLLETIRRFASDRLVEAAEQADVSDRHYQYFVEFAETVEHGFIYGDQDEWLPRIAVEHENLRAALEWTLATGKPGRSRRLAAAMVWLWYLHGHSVEGLGYLRRVIGLEPDDRSQLQARLYCGVAAAAVASGQFTVMAEAAHRALEIADANGDDRYTARALFLLATVQSYLDFEQSWRLCATALEHAAAADDPFVGGAALVLQGTVLSHRDRFDEARPLLEQGFDACMRRKDRYFAALAQALAVAQPLGDYYSVGQATAHLALAEGLAGDIDAARALIDPVVRSIEGADHGVYVPRLAPVLGKLSLWVGDYEAAVVWFERDVRHADPLKPSLIVARSLPGLAAALRHLGRLDEARQRITEAMAVARKLEMWHLVADALEQSAHLAEPDDPAGAEDLHHAALALRVDYGLRTFYVDSLDALAALALKAQSPAEATRILAASSAARSTMGYPRRPADEPAHRAVVDAAHAALADDEFATAWGEGSALSLEDAVAYVRRARGTRDRPTIGWASLTPTEVQVVRLVVEGMNNPEIAARMFISRGTVKSHLSHIFAKLGVANRTGLATMASPLLSDGREAGRRSHAEQARE
jgi:predicted ATPase/DNA-binding CsgD family transcriptional regulator